MTAEKQRPEKAGTPAKNRAWGKNGERVKFAYKIPPQALGLQQGICPRVTETVSGRPRWLSRDPIGENGGVNLYAMVGNDPVNHWDYLGMNPGAEFNSRAEAEDNAVEYIKLKSQQEFEAGLSSVKAALKISSGASNLEDLVAYLKAKNFGRKAFNAMRAGATKYSIIRKTSRFQMEAVVGKELGAAIYAYSSGGKRKYSYGFYSGEVSFDVALKPMSDDWWPRGSGASMVADFDENLFLASRHKEVSCYVTTFIHNHSPIDKLFWTLQDGEIVWVHTGANRPIGFSPEDQDVETASTRRSNSPEGFSLWAIEKGDRIFKTPR